MKPSAVMQLSGKVIEFSMQMLPQLREAAEQSPLRRARFNLHDSSDHPLHQMVIGLLEDSYARRTSTQARWKPSKWLAVS